MGGPARLVWLEVVKRRWSKSRYLKRHYRLPDNSEAQADQQFSGPRKVDVADRRSDRNLKETAEEAAAEAIREEAGEIVKEAAGEAAQEAADEADGRKRSLS
jgi:hypothetical protein